LAPAAQAELNTVDVARAICAALQPLTGPAASGKLLVRATGASVVLKPGAMAVPIRGSLDESGIAFVQPNAANAAGWTVTAAGTLVDVAALHGGPIGNSESGTVFRWAPTISGLEETATADASGISGGAFLAVSPIRQVRLYKQIDRADVEQLFRAQVSESPALVLAWEATQPLGGSMGSSPGPRTARTGVDTVLYRHTWSLFLITSRLDTEGERRDEGDAIRDAVMGRLHQRAVARKLRLSNSPGTEILEARVYKVTPTSYVDLIRVGTIASMQFQGDAQFNDWMRTRIREQTTEQGSAKIDLPDITVPMTKT